MCENYEDYVLLVRFVLMATCWSAISDRLFIIVTDIPFITPHVSGVMGVIVLALSVCVCVSVQLGE